MLLYVEHNYVVSGGIGVITRNGSSVQGSNEDGKH